MLTTPRALLVVTAMLFLVTASVNLAMPLFRVYVAAAGYGVGMVSLAFAAYIAGLLPTSLLLGGLSRRTGMRFVLWLALGLATLSVAIITLFPNLPALFVSRLVGGCSVSLVIATGSAYLSQLFTVEPEKNASVRVALATSLGFGGGALLTSIALGVWGPSLVPLTYFLFLGLMVACLLLSFRLPAVDRPQPGRLIQLPLFPAGSLRFNLTIAVAWAVTGVVIAIVPSQLEHFTLGGWSGLAVFLVNATGSVCLPLARRLSVERNLTITYLLLPSSLALLTWGSLTGQLAAVLAGCALNGAVGYGFAYYGTLAGVSALDPARKPRVVAGYLLLAYTGFGLPSVFIGLGSEVYGIAAAMTVYVAATGVACLGLLIGGRW